MEFIGSENTATQLQKFLPKAVLLEVIPMTQGLINETYCLKTTQGDFLLQKLNTAVFKAATPLMENIRMFQEIPCPKEFQSPKFIQDPQGQLLVKDPQGQLWRLQEFIPNAVAYDLAPKLSIAKQAGQLLCQFHQITAAGALDKFHTPLSGFQDIQLRLDQFSKAFKKADTQLIKTAQPALELIESLSNFVKNIPKSLPQRLCHNDTKLNNMLFHKKTHQGLCLVDLDTLMPGHAFYDFGDAFRTIANTAIEGDLKATVGFKKEFALAFIQGLAQTKGVYSQREWSSFALGAVYMPFIHGLRALTDFLEGNRYYQVSYATENLDRSLSLLAFAMQAYEQQNFIKECLQKNWNP